MNKRTVRQENLVIYGETGEEVLVIGERFDEENVYLTLQGKINMSTAYDFEDELTAAATVRNRIILDFSGVDAISSAGIKALLLVQRILDKRADGELKLRSMKATVYEMFDEMGFSDLFEIEA